MIKKFSRTRKVVLEVHDEVKYTDVNFGKEIEYSNVIGFEVVEGEQAKQIEEETDGSCMDDNHEYLVLYFEDGTTGTYRNSYVDLFVI